MKVNVKSKDAFEVLSICGNSLLNKQHGAWLLEKFSLGFCTTAVTVFESLGYHLEYGILSEISAILTWGLFSFILLFGGRGENSC